MISTLGNQQKLKFSEISLQKIFVGAIKNAEFDTTRSHILMRFIDCAQLSMCVQYSIWDVYCILGPNLLLDISNLS